MAPMTKLEFLSTLRFWIMRKGTAKPLAFMFPSEMQGINRSVRHLIETWPNEAPNDLKTLTISLKDVGSHLKVSFNAWSFHPTTSLPSTPET